MQIKFKRWPWQGYDDCGLGRFGGGWNYSLGIQFGRNSAIINLLWGMIRITWGKKK